jgi:flagellar biosynthesis/type III secretory pathway protein FliH
MEPMEWKPTTISSGTIPKDQNGRATFSQKKPKDESAPDGPARVVKSKDWGAVPDGSMKDFSLSAFSMPGRAVPPPDPHEVQLAQMAKDALKVMEANKRALKKAVQDGESATIAARVAGRAEGLEEGRRLASEKFEKDLETLQTNSRNILEAFSQEKASLFLEFEGQVLELVSGCIHRVFEGMAVGPAEVVLPLLKRAVTAIGEASTVTIKIHPDDFKVVEGNRDYWLPVSASLKDVHVVADERIAKGGCFVESDSTSVTAHAQEMADRIDEELKKVFLAKLQVLGNQGPFTNPPLGTDIKALEKAEIPDLSVSEEDLDLDIGSLMDDIEPAP